ncbi:MAG: YbjN domain-containing protein [Armatimonadetes bacterium]|nr:YbjN domain-containing protein [Armatimonadota bacterium]
MVDNETIDSYLIQMGHPTQSLREGIWKVDNDTDDVPPVIVSHEPPIVYVRLKMVDLPERHREKLYAKLLEFNASGLAFGAYAVQDDEVLLIDTLRSESLDLDELQASIESLQLASQQHYRELQELLQVGQE